MIQLSKRLQAVADLITDERTEKLTCVADVGTDHGYIPVYLVEQGIAEEAIAMDIRKGPLQRAKEHIREHQLGAYIETRLSDGLAALKKDEARAIVIAGMGGATMRSVLEKGKAVIGPDTVLVLQPQSELAQFRKYLFEQDFLLQKEDMVEEDGKFYPMMRVQKRKDGQEQKAYTDMELMFGPLLLAKRHPVLKKYLLYLSDKKKQINCRLNQLEQEERRMQRVREIEKEIEIIGQALQLF